MMAQVQQWRLLVPTPPTMMQAIRHYENMENMYNKNKRRTTWALIPLEDT